MNSQMLIILTLMHISAMRFQSLFILMPLRISRSEIKLTQEKQFKQERRNLQHQELNWTRRACVSRASQLARIHYSMWFNKIPLEEIFILRICSPLLNCYHRWVFKLCLTVYLIKKIKIIHICYYDLFYH
jgi:hypothetical protein